LATALSPRSGTWWATSTRWATACLPLGFLTHIHYYRGLGLLTSFLLFLVTGFLTRYLVTRQMISAGEALVDRIPIASKVYKATQQIRDVFTAREGGVVQQVVIVEYPSPNMYAIGFVISTNTRGAVARVIGEELVPVFLIFTPPTAGFLLHFPKDKVTADRHHHGRRDEADDVGRRL
jgi:uncharacterized membrane protein